MPSESFQPFKQSVVRSLRHAWSTLTKKDLDDETQFDPFASTWFLADEGAINQNLTGCAGPTRRSALVDSSSFDSFSDALSTTPESQSSLTQSIEEFPDELTSFLPSFDSPPSSPRSSISYESHSLEGSQISDPSPEPGHFRDRYSRQSLFLDLMEDSFGDHNNSRKILQSPRLEFSTPGTNFTSPDSHKRTHRTRTSIDVRFISDCGPASIQCWRPLSWSGLLGVVSLRTKRPKNEIAFVCENYPNVISTEEEYDAMLAWLFASTNNNSRPKFDLWVVNKTLTSGRMHIGSPGPRAQSSSGFLRATPPRKQLRRAATTLMSSPRISEAPPLSWKLGTHSEEYSGSNSTENSLRGWI